MKNKALAIIDAERCFFPETEGERLGVEGFGELGVPGGEKIVGPINKLTTMAIGEFLPIVYTVDQHPMETGHFSEDPNFVNTWPPHGRAGTPGGELHPDLLIARHSSVSGRFIKGDVVAAGPEDDTSYTGRLAHDPDTGELMFDSLRRHKATEIYVAGLALGDGAENMLCVDSTATDLKKAGFEVTVVSDAVEAVLPENRELCFKNMGDLGIRLLTTAEVLAEVEAAYN